MRYQAALRPDRPFWAGEATSAGWAPMQAAMGDGGRVGAIFARALDLAVELPISTALAVGGMQRHVARHAPA